METTRKAFVVLAAAVTAGNFTACGSDKVEDAVADAAATPDTKVVADAASTPDAKVVADAAATPDAPVVPDAATPDTKVVVDAPATPDTKLAIDTSSNLDTQVSVDTGNVVDVGRDSVTLIADASIPSPDTNPILTMPAGTVYDVLIRRDIS
jgi:hypothetical protein